MRLRDCDFVHTAASQIELAVRSGHHVADHAATGRDGSAGEGLGLGIEFHQRIRFYAGFAEPDLSVRSHSDAIRLGSRAPWSWPLFQLAGLKVEVAEIAASVVGIINGIVMSQREPARMSSFRQRIFRDLHGLGINGGQLVGPELTENWNSF